MTKFALALGGGGTKGAYHIGVYNALYDMGIEISAICGTSIGSINGAVLAQGDLEKANYLWKNITLDDIVDVSDIENVGTNLFDVKSMASVLSVMHKNNGLKTEPLRRLLEEIIDEEKLRKSNISYGLVTYSVYDMEAKEMFLDDIPKKKLIDYIMASASMPGLEQIKIEEKKFLDGGFGDNVPANMLVNKGYKNIITVNVGGFGIIKEIPKIGINHIDIKCRENIIGLLDFDAENIDKMIKLGYYDTLKAFGRTCGEKYSFNISDYHKSALKYSKDIIFAIERAAEIYGIDRFKIYRFDDLVRGVLEKYKYNAQKYPINNENFNISKEILNLGDRQILTRLVSIINEGKIDYAALKFFNSIIKDKVTAANSIVYFLNSEDR